MRDAKRMAAHALADGTVQALMSFAFSVSGPFLPLFIIQLGVKPIAAVSIWAGAIASVNFLAAAIFSPIWGGLADRTGRKAMVVRSCVAIASLRR